MDETGPGLEAQIRQRTLEQLPSLSCCVICLDQIHEPGEAVPCGHDNFDYICLTQWLSRTPRCPLCVQNVTGVKHRVDDKELITPVEPPAKPEAKTSPATAPTQNDLFLNPYRLRNERRRSRPRRARPYTPSSAEAGIDSRRRVYQQSLYSKHVGSNRMSQYRELTPALFTADARLVSRARTFLRRELQVFPFLTAEATDASASQRRADNAEFLLEYIIAVLKSVDIVGGRAEDLVADFLGRENTRLFLHELRAWLRSPFEKLEDWDRAVQYAAPVAAAARPSSSADSSQGLQPFRGDSWRPSYRNRRKGDRRRIDEGRAQRDAHRH